MKDIIQYIFAGTIAAIILYLILTNGNTAVALTQAGGNAVTQYIKTLQGR